MDLLKRREPERQNNFFRMPQTQRERRRFAYLFLGVGMLFLIISQAESFLRIGQTILSSSSRERVNTRMPLPAYVEPLPYGAVRMELVDTEAATDSEPAVESPEKPAAGTVTGPDNSQPLAPVQSAESKETPAASKSRHFTGVDAELLKLIQPDEPFRKAEDPVWYHLFTVVRDTDPLKLQTAAEKITDFRSLFDQQSYLRGKAVTLIGSLRWIEPETESADNPLGIDKRYLVGIQLPQDDNPIFAYCLQAPAELPVGKPTPGYPQRHEYEVGAVPVRVTGLYMKNVGYPAGDAWRMAPAILCKSVEVLPRQIKTQEPLISTGLLLLLLGLGALVIFPLVYFLTRPSIGMTITPSQIVGIDAENDSTVDLRSLDIPDGRETPDRD